MGYSMVKVNDIEGEGPGGAVRFVRRHLGVEAFGINWYEIPPNTEGREHDESNSAQEEVNVIIQGSGMYRVDGEIVPSRRVRFFASIRRPRVVRSPGRRG